MTTTRTRRRYSAKAYWAPILAFYAASLALPFIFTQGVHLLRVSWVLALGTGAAFVLATKRCNLFVLLTVGFSQFVVLMLPAAVQNPDLLQETFAIRIPAQIAVACAFGGLVAELAQRRTLSLSVVSVADYIGWLNPIGRPKSEETFDRIEFFQKLVTYVGNLWTLWTVLRPYW